MYFAPLNMAYTMKIFIMVSLHITAQAIYAQQELSLPPLPATGKGDTIPHAITLYDGEWILYKRLEDIVLTSKISLEQYKEWIRLERAVKKVFPYAKMIGAKILSMRQEMDKLPSKQAKRNYLQSKEKDLMATFMPVLKKMSRFQGQVLIKLVNRESGNSCYEMLKEYKGGFAAGIWEAFANLFGNTLKAAYEPDNNLQDRHIELLVQGLEDQQVY